MFGSAYLAEDPSNRKQFIVKEYTNRGNCLKTQELIEKETLK